MYLDASAFEVMSPPPIMKPAVFVVLGGSRGDWEPVERMFKHDGWRVADFISQADLVVFCGGSDVSPSLYGEKNTSSYCDPARDEYEISRYKYAKSLNIPMVGICRGGQFLNVMNGGKMIQHIDGHSGDREITIPATEYGEPSRVLTIREDHHQGIVPAIGSEILAWDEKDGNVEIVYYADTNCLCFQPHPEWGHDPTRKLFFQLLEEYL